MQYPHEKMETKSLRRTESNIKACDSAEVETVQMLGKSKL